MSILSIANSGLNAFQSALAVTGNNIANAKTRGYSRQTINFTPSLSQRFSSSFIGTGVSVNSIYRNADQFANYQVRNTQSFKSQYETFYQQASQIDKLLSQDGTNISTSLQSFFDALGQLNNSPDTGASRDVTLRQSQLLVQQFNFLQTKLDEYQNNSTAQISQATQQINQITRGIADANRQLMSTPDAPELLDQRDELLKQLSQFVDVTTFDQGDGTINVGIASGEMLVAGTAQRDLVVSSDQSNTAGTKVLLGNGAGQLDITSKLTSGMIGGLLTYEQSVLGQASQMIGQMAIGLAQKFNAQHRLGMDMNNQLGKDFFTDYNSLTQQLNRSTASSNNTGTGVLSVNISDISQTQLSDYQLVVSDVLTNQIRVIRQSDGESTILNWSSNPPAPPAGQVVIDGMTITVDDIANLANKDTYTLTPTRGAARDFALQITDARQIAMASPVVTSASLSNTGIGQIALGTVFNTTAVNNQYRIDFISDTQFNLVDLTNNTTTGPLPFVPNSDNTIQIPDALNPSYSVVLSGIPKTGDQFTANYNAGGIGDNHNGLLLAGLQSNKFFSGGSEGLFDRYSDLLVDVGGQTKLAKNSYEASDILFKQAVDYQDSISGVNLDEEAANLLKFEQAYEAAGKLMAVANQMINVLFDMMR
ncbi:flagellar hook-associated protein FlgK [Legionella maioricensis]|uniref:Flagellar hook-associated protein 1 n=1 Tax=Legionella maioricensis TaxID=2896528 RepID=A0A9X2D2I5_9GAMM|nr:flagellar hook-associated protein FlgK [Legionella maioricensis]MCL9685374.1 flagellar hook-associated protein FlgK [Legionella maioricensis]MCL9688667.1 flagellar hook-associated protein FlgK [Legionella maioricensis]